MPSRAKQFTIYDAMEARGVFDLNPANAGARNLETGEQLYTGPVEFPKMLYHPEGEEKITVPAEMVATPMGPRWLNQQSELISATVHNSREEKKLLEEGWHLTPAESKAAGQGRAKSTPQPTVEDLQAELAAVKAQLATAHSDSLGGARAVGAKLVNKSASAPAL